MMMPAGPDYPAMVETDRMIEIGRQRHTQAIGEFLEWLGGQGIQLCRWREDLTDARPCSLAVTPGTHAPRWGCVEGRSARYGSVTNEVGEAYGECAHCAGRGYVEVPADARFAPEPWTTERLLAQYIEIDMDKVEVERRDLLEHVRKVNRGEKS